MFRKTVETEGPCCFIFLCLVAEVKAAPPRGSSWQEGWVLLALHHTFTSFFFFFFFWLSLVFVAARGLFSSCGEQGLLFVEVRGLLIAVACLVAEHRL